MAKGPSFTRFVKEDIIRNKAQDEVQYTRARKRAMLGAFVRLNGSVEEDENGKYLLIRTENPKIARFFYNILIELYDLEPSFSYETLVQFKRRRYYTIEVKEKVSYIVEDLASEPFGSAIDRKLVYSDDTAAGYAAGAFLAKGSVNSPISSNYHLEISTKDEVLASKLCRLIEKFRHANFTPRVSKRREQYIVYLKRSDQIGEFLIFIGATAASLEFEKIRIDRDMTNAARRMALCDAANYNKTLTSAQKQIDDINLIKSKTGLNQFENPKIKPLCELRLANEDMSMSELAAALSEQLNLNPPVTKSNIAHLFRQIRKVANNYRKDKTDD